MLFDREKGVMYELNETASSIVAMLMTGPQSTSSLIDALASDYRGSSAGITADIDSFVADFLEAGLLQRVEEGNE